MQMDGIILYGVQEEQMQNRLKIPRSKMPTKQEVNNMWD